jgi:hypothetical protein
MTGTISVVHARLRSGTAFARALVEIEQRNWRVLSTLRSGRQV